MSTHSQIGLERNNGEVDAVYCHFDGYLDGVGSTLLEHYADIRKVEALVALGSISSLGHEIGEKHIFRDNIAQKLNWTEAYHRDRGEDLEVGHYTDRDDFMTSTDEHYTYLYSEKDGKWLYLNHKSNDLVPLTAEAIKRGEEEDEEEEE